MKMNAMATVLLVLNASILVNCESLVGDYKLEEALENGKEVSMPDWKSYLNINETNITEDAKYYRFMFKDSNRMWATLKVNSNGDSTFLGELASTRMRPGPSEEYIHRVVNSHLGYERNGGKLKLKGKDGTELIYTH